MDDTIFRGVVKNTILFSMIVGLAIGLIFSGAYSIFNEYNVRVNIQKNQSNITTNTITITNFVTQ